jgi:DNA-binding response OmpR family regulator
MKENKPHRPFRVLAVDDQPEILNLLQSTLGAEGFDVTVAQDAVSGLRAAYEIHPDLILLDVRMPGVDGFEMCRRLREMTDVPIIFVTAMATIEDTVRGFALGADDYVVKPFRSAELLSRVAACLRRAGRQEAERAELLFASASATLDCDRHELVMEDRTVHLTPKEFEVLRLLVHHAGKVLSTDAILTRVWGPELIGEPHLVKQYVYRLRQKIESDPAAPRYLHTVRGAGYYFDAEDLL